MHILNTKQKKSKHISKKKYKNAILNDYTKRVRISLRITNQSAQIEKTKRQKEQRNTNIQNINFTNKPRHKNDFFTHKLQFLWINR